MVKRGRPSQSLSASAMCRAHYHVKWYINPWTDVQDMCIILLAHINANVQSKTSLIFCQQPAAQA